MFSQTQSWIAISVNKSNNFYIGSKCDNKSKIHIMKFPSVHSVTFDHDHHNKDYFKFLMVLIKCRQQHAFFHGQLPLVCLSVIGARNEDRTVRMRKPLVVWRPCGRLLQTQRWNICLRLSKHLCRLSSVSFSFLSWAMRTSLIHSDLSACLYTMERPW